MKIIIMTNHQIHLVKSTWQLAAAHADVVGPMFYNRLFEIAPEVKPLFGRTTIPEQSKKLLAMLTYVIRKLDRLEDILDEVAMLAKRHVKYGVEAKHFDAVGAALLWTLEKGLGEHWNEEVKTAWITCYTLLSSAMISSMEEAQKDAA